MNEPEDQKERAEKTHRATASPLDVAGVDLGISPDEIVQFVHEGRRSRPPMIAKSATGQPIPALSAEELTAMEVDEDLERYAQSTQARNKNFLDAEKPRQSEFKQATRSVCCTLRRRITSIFGR